MFIRYKFINIREIDIPFLNFQSESISIDCR